MSVTKMALPGIYEISVISMCCTRAPIYIQCCVVLYNVHCLVTWRQSVGNEGRWRLLEVSILPNIAVVSNMSVYLAVVLVHLIVLRLLTVLRHLTGVL
jgi:hypothetical protein